MIETAGETALLTPLTECMRALRRAGNWTDGLTGQAMIAAVAIMLAVMVGTAF
ncbi:MAG: hypothetical protein AAF724_20825 [Pseudomonadota bacterium]